MNKEKKNETEVLDEETAAGEINSEGAANEDAEANANEDAQGSAEKKKVLTLGEILAAKNAEIEAKKKDIEEKETGKPDSNGADNDKGKGGNKDACAGASGKPEGNDSAKGAADKDKFQAEKHWSAEQKEFFNGLDDAGKEKVLGMYKNIQRVYEAKTNEISGLKKEYEGMDNVFRPVNDWFKKSGVSKAQYVKALMEADKQMNTSPTEFIINLMEKAGINLDVLAQEISGYVYRQSDPNYRKMASAQEEAQAAKEYIMQAEEAKANAAIEEMANAVNEDGSPKYAYFNEVLDVMAQISQVTGETDLTKLYDTAIWQKVEIREQMIKGQKDRETSAQKKQEEIEKNKKAKIAVKSSLSGASIGQIKTGTKTLAEIIKEADSENED